MADDEEALEEPDDFADESEDEEPEDLVAEPLEGEVHASELVDEAVAMGVGSEPHPSASQGLDVVKHNHLPVPHNRDPADFAGI